MEVDSRPVDAGYESDDVEMGDYVAGLATFDEVRFDVAFVRFINQLEREK